MSDALCGPSNPLQSFRKHTQLDRTLQQDRLVSRPQPGGREQFRRFDPRAGSLDKELYDFEHSTTHPLGFEQEIHGQILPGYVQPQQQHGLPPTMAEGWAADFQRMNIRQTPSPIPVSQFRSEAPLVKSSSGWHADFLRQSGYSTTASVKGKEVQANNQPQYTYQPQHDGMYTSPYAMGHDQFQINHRQQQSHPPQDFSHLSDSDFEAAFNDAVMSEAAALQQQQASPQLQAQPSTDFDIDIDMQPPSYKIGSDTINYTLAADRTPDQDLRDADELARTAGQLLNLVKDDTSDKMRNSQFLNLMRSLRDREVQVRNGDIVGTDTANQTSKQGIVESIANPYPAATLPTQVPDSSTSDANNQFHFPNMDDIYAPTNNDLDGASHSFTSSPVLAPASRIRANSVPRRPTFESENLYNTTSDEFPSSQVQALHPGGRNYPHSAVLEMSGAVAGAGTNIRVEDFETGASEESSSLGRRFGGSGHMEF